MSQYVSLQISNKKPLDHQRFRGFIVVKKYSNDIECLLFSN